MKAVAVVSIYLISLYHIEDIVYVVKFYTNYIRLNIIQQILKM